MTTPPGPKYFWLKNGPGCVTTASRLAFSWNRDHEAAWEAIFRFISFFLKLGYGGIQLIQDERLRIQARTVSIWRPSRTWRPGVNVVLIIFGHFGKFSAKKNWRFSWKSMFRPIICNELAVYRVQNDNLFAKFFGENNFQIITSVPVPSTLVYPQGDNFGHLRVIFYPSEWPITLPLILKGEHSMLEDWTVIRVCLKLSRFCLMIKLFLKQKIQIVCR
jgi:hypothetical protein